MNKYDDVLPIEDMPSLAKRLGKSGIERVRYPAIVTGKQPPDFI